MDNYFKKLYETNVQDKVKKKNNLNYISWGAAWSEIKLAHPDANYTEYEREDGRFWFDDGKTGWVKVGVTVNGIEHIEHYPIMDLRNNPIPADEITAVHANKAKMRAFAKACARHGIALYLYLGDDEPEIEKKQKSDLEKGITSVIALCKKKVEKEGYDKDILYKVISDLNDGNRNPSSIKDLETCERIIQTIKKM